jgi:hypothetical protein
MGKRRNVRQNLMPKHERTEPGPKFQLRDLSAESQEKNHAINSEMNAMTTSFASSTSLCPSAGPSSGSFLLQVRRDCDSLGDARCVNQSPLEAVSYDRLPDDVLVMIFRAAGFLAIVNATFVSRNWRRVARSLMESTRRIETVHLFRPLPRHLWSRKTVYRALSAFPNISALSLRGWPTGTAQANVPTFILRHFSSASLEELNVSGVDFEAQDLFVFLANCPGLRNLKLAGCPCVNDTMLRSLIRHRADRHGGGPREHRHVRPLARLDISQCTSVGVRGIQDLLQELVAESVVASKTSCRGLLYAANCRVDKLNLASSRSLFFASIDAKPGCLHELNLSQCTSLSRLVIASSEASPQPLALRKLNFSGNSQLQDVEFILSAEAQGNSAVGGHGASDGDIHSAAPPLGGSTGGTNTRHHLHNMEELSMFGARSLGPEFFRNRLGFSSSSRCPMPMLKTLELNGCLGLDRLILVGYRCLKLVDCGGCAFLDHLEIRDAPLLQRVDVQTKQAPLRLVDMEIPIDATILGTRRAWSRQSTSRTQTISFRWA